MTGGGTAPAARFNKSEECVMGASVKAKRTKKDYTGVADRYRQGERLVDLAAEYGITRSGMYLRLKDEGVAEFRDERRKIDTAAVIDLHMQGMTMTDIAKRYGCTVSAVSMMLKKHNVTSRRKAITPDLENIAVAIPDVPKDTFGAFKEFQKDFGRQLTDDRVSFTTWFGDDDSDLAEIKTLLDL